ncbi:DMP19 family protein [Arcticibacter tournemirensis]|uniref:DUF4375 domain-containing protein n=1 Tax=Arcticibacter tournemirensis TaxID=699437 RepID=A0A4Q0ME82_9SPHI|nr:DUF4375 domain-containing protein [Arcticibacter tournemirensis]RXF71279.1 DUF4375 domain-containing protein [Arcticibacter tournemirensis]
MRLQDILIKFRFIVLLTGICCFCSTIVRAQYFADSSGLEGGLAGQVLESAKEYKNRTIYTNLTPDVIDSAPDNKLSQIITDYIRSKMNKRLSNEYEVLMQEPEQLRTIYIISQVEAEVNNGGFAQFYSSTAGRLGEQAEKAFEAIQASHLASLIKKANSTYKAEGITDKLKSLDEQFFSLYEKEDLCELKVKYIRKNKKALTNN